MARACCMTGMRVVVQRRQARTEPGKLTMMLWPIMPASPRESMADGVSLSDAARRASEMPGRRLSMRAVVTSGVISRGEMPVPPVVRMKSAALCRTVSPPPGLETVPQ